jgi:long-chain acyl-CoA synthetase
MTSRPWLQHYDPGVPPTLEPYPDETLVDALNRCAREHPDAIALRFEGATTTFAELLRESEAFGRALEGLGVKPGDRVVLVLPNVPQFVVAQFGAWLAGAIVAPINFTYPDDEIAAMISRCSATTAVVLSMQYERIKSIQPRTSLQRIVVAYVRDTLPTVKGILYRFFREKKDGHAATPRGADHPMQQLLRRFRNQRPGAPAPRPSDTAVLLPSGGTTGTPKWVMGSHGGIAVSGRQLFAWLHSVLEPWRDTLLLPLPLFHMYGMEGVQSAAFMGGLSMTLIANPRDVKGVLRTIRRERPAFICAVPTMLTALMSDSDLEQTREAFHSVKLCFSGAAALLAETKRRWEELTGGLVVEGYSLTEAQMATIANPARGEKKIGSVGMPLPDVDLRLVDVDTGEHEVAPGEQGEVLISGRQLMIGYWEQPEETASVLTVDADGRRWLHTGDIGYLDPDGYLFLTDRKKELIKVSGYQVWPREIEEALAQHPAVLEVGAIGISHPRRGEVPAAWVVLRPDTTATPAELRAFARNILAPYKVPAEVYLVTELPKSAIGKVLRRKLRELVPQEA